MRRPRTALIAAILGLAPVVSVGIAQQFPSGPPPQTRGADAAIDAMASARSPRALLRNGLDYLEIGDFDRALPLLREAEPRRAELSPKEQNALDQGIADAQKGLRAAANAPGRPSGRGKSARRPGAMALANPNAAPRSFGPDPIQLTSATVTEAPPAALVLEPTPMPPQEPAGLPALPVTAPQPVQPAQPPAGPLPPMPTVSAMTGPAVFGVAPSRAPVNPSLPVDAAAATSPTPPPEPIRDLATTPPEPASSSPASANPAPAAEPSPVLAAPPEPAAAAAPQPASMPVSEPYPIAAPVGIPEPRAARPYKMSAAEPAAETRARAFAEAPTAPVSPGTPPAASESVQSPAIEPPPAPAAETIGAPVRDTPPAAAPGASASAAGLPALPSGLSTTPATTPSEARQPISSRLAPEIQLEVDRIARRQDERARLNSIQQPGMPAPGVILPGADPDAGTGADLSGSRLELPRAPSPTEARAIRPIPVPEEFVPLPPRQWVPTRKFWTAPATCHMPLYFQNAVIERYGQSIEQNLGPAGRYFSYPLDDPKESKQRNYILAPIAGAALFAVQVAALPVNAVLDPPWEAEWDLGYYRPGDRIPPDTTYFPQWGVGPPFVGRRY